MLSFEIFFTETILYRALLKNVSYANEIKLTVYFTFFFWLHGLYVLVKNKCVSKIWQDTNLLINV